MFKKHFSNVHQNFDPVYSKTYTIGQPINHYFTKNCNNLFFFLGYCMVVKKNLSCGHRA